MNYFAKSFGEDELTCWINSNENLNLNNTQFQKAIDAGKRQFFDL